MKKFLFLLALFILFFVAGSEDVHDPSTFLTEMKNGVSELKEKIDLETTKAAIDRFLRRIGVQISDEEIDEEIDEEEPSTPVLQSPSTEQFAVYNIEIGDQKEKIEKRVGKPQRISLNEYDVYWHTYHESYRNFFMVSYDQHGIVNGIYTNQPLFSSSIGMESGWTKEETRSRLGNPLESLKKGRIVYKLPEDRNYDLFLIDGNYVTIFYDQFEKESIRAIQIIRGDLEEKKSTLYPEGRPELIEGFEYQLYDLTNAERVKYGLNPLVWDRDVQITAKKHSEDMAANGYFSHENLKGQSPFDRMKEDAIFYTVAGENLAYGQFSSIFAHEGLMNSKGHRENILQKDFERIGIGVAFNEEQQPYFTQNFYKK
ncbi:CAP-associated domain-containing protein [Fervidibacillus albus]|uniref:CAP-associated domain-containing protein n=1 Tax=Fervidibacillus albus TaxID=2980026 RepID=A0A9E8RVT3_9BACI|nr:CAP-associated domain-containing protein [Fervidibacillus albus]WAA11010.1 CAP-associated domain-containing protein [Fervidibacillus albus]